MVPGQVQVLVAGCPEVVVCEEVVKEGPQRVSVCAEASPVGLVVKSKLIYVTAKVSAGQVLSAYYEGVVPYYEASLSDSGLPLSQY